MSFFVGPVSGALVAGGVYYGFSNLITTRTEALRKDLNALSIRLVETPALISAPLPAAARIRQRLFTSLLKEKWNREVACLFAGFGEWDRRVGALGRKWLDKAVAGLNSEPSRG